MKKLLLLMVAALMLSGCVVYPDGYYGADYNSYPYGYYPYGYVSPSLSFYFSNSHGGHGFHHGGHGGHRGGFRR